MTKKTFSKVVAAVVVACMCLTAIFTASVSADTRLVTCTVVGGTYNQLAEGEYVTYEVTFESDNPFTAGTFSVDCPSNLTFVSCSYAQGAQGNDPQVYVNVSGKKVLFAGFKEDNSNTINEFGSLTFLLKFKRTDAATQWTVSVNNISITNAEEETYNLSGSSVTSDVVAHIHSFGAGTTENGVTKYTCSVCSEVKIEVASNATVTPNTLANGEKSANITFAKDGDVVLNALLPAGSYPASGTVYFAYSYSDGVNDAPATATVAGEEVTIGGVDYYAFPCGRNAGIGRMARDIRGNFVVMDGGTVLSKSSEWKYSVKQCLEKLIADGDAATKDYAKALWNYGKYTTNMLHSTNTAFYGAEDDAFSGAEKGEFSTALAWPTIPNLDNQGKSKYTGTDTSWYVSKISVTTGYTPKINFTLSQNVSSVTFKLYSDVNKTALVYSKEIDVNNTNTFTITDIPAKYLKGEFEVSIPNSDRVFNYSIVRYANARASKDDGNIYKWMVKYSQYLSTAFQN